MSPQDLRHVLDWAADEGWNPGLDDAEAFLPVDPEGFFLATDGDEPVAAISVVNHTQDFAFLGLYLCRPGWRGRGIGYALWQEALRHAGARTIGLDGVPAQQGNYARSGFALAGGTTRYTGVLPSADDGRIRPAARPDLDAMIGLEAEASGVRKERYLRLWLTDAETRRSYVFDASGKVRGFFTLRRCRTGYKIGPLVAATAEIGRALLEKAGALAAGGQVSIDVPDQMSELLRICVDLRMSPGFSTARMYLGTRPVSSGAIAAVTSLELG